MTGRAIDRGPARRGRAAAAAADRLARDRPRPAARQPGRAPGRGPVRCPDRTRPQGRRVRPRRGARSGWPSRPPAPTASRWPPSTRPSSCGWAASARRCSASTRSRRPSSRRRCDSCRRECLRRRSARSDVAAAAVGLGGRPAAATAGVPRPSRRRDRSRTSRSGHPTDSRPLVARLRDEPRGPAGRHLVASPAGRRPAADRPSGRIGSRRPWRAGRGWRAGPAPSCRRERRPARSGRADLRRGPDRSRDLRHRPRRRPVDRGGRPPGHGRSDRSCRSMPGRSESPTCRAGTGISYGPSFTTARPSRIATLPLGYGDGVPRVLSNRAQALVRGGRVPLVGNVAMDAVMVDVTDVPGPPGDDRRRVRPDRVAGRRDRSPSKRWRDCAPPTRGKRSRPCPGDCPGCTMPRRYRWRSGPSRRGGIR